MRTGVSPKRIATGNFWFVVSFMAMRFAYTPPESFDLPWQINNNATSTSSSLERRWSSRTFRYGYLVTTSPQLSCLPSAAPSPYWTRLVSDLVPYFFYGYNRTSSIITLSCSPGVGSPTSGIHDSHGVTGGVYKTRERIHRDILIRDY